MQEALDTCALGLARVVDEGACRGPAISCRGRVPARGARSGGWRLDYGAEVRFACLCPRDDDQGAGHGEEGARTGSGRRAPGGFCPLGDNVFR